jgi:alkylation response protein AidB-like acyl-CoA dehydrogenase
MGGVIAADDPTTVTNVHFTADETRVIDTWDVSGLRGTASHDIEATDVVVPRARTFSLLRDTPKDGSHALPVFGTLAAGVAAVGLGIARAALDSFADLARNKRPPGAKRTLAQRESVQLDVGRADARLEAARAHLFACMDAATANGNDLVVRAKLRLAACHAAEEAAAVATLAYRAGGGSAVYAKHPLQRHLRDAQVVTQHLMVSSTAATTAGAVLLGVETDTATL